MTITLKELFSKAYPDGRFQNSVPDVNVSGIECDSRKVEPGFLFVAVRGASQDGHAFIRDAVLRGAAAVAGDRVDPMPPGLGVPFIPLPDARAGAADLAAAFYHHPSSRLDVIGITGTNGKTTCSYLIEHLLKRCLRKPVGVIGTVSYRFAGKEIPALETTPGPLRLQRLFSEMALAGCRFAVMEVSSHALDQERIRGVNFRSALFTNLTQDHLDYHGSMDAYFEAKARLFSGLGAGAAAVINADDARAGNLVGRISCATIRYSMNGNSELCAQAVNPAGAFMEFEIHYEGKKRNVRLPLIGLHNVYNALGSLGVLHGLGFDWRECAEALESFGGAPGRLEAVSSGQDFMVFVDFAHTPDGLMNVLSSLIPHRKRKLIAVFGCGGDRDRTKRPKMAKIASDFCDFVFVTSDNPRSEDPRRIAEEVCSGFPADFKNVAVILDRRKAIRQALLSARAGDVVLLAGKGHEQSQIVGSERLPFNDRAEAEKVLRGH